MLQLTAIGRLTKVPEIKKNNKGTDFVVFNLAVNKGYGDNQTTTYVSCCAGGILVSPLSKAKKGSLITITGELSTELYQKRDGSWAVNTKCLISSFNYINAGNGQKNNQNGNGSNQQQYNQNGNQQNQYNQNGSQQNQYNENPHSGSGQYAPPSNQGQQNNHQYSRQGNQQYAPQSYQHAQQYAAPGQYSAPQNYGTPVALSKAQISESTFSKTLRSE